MACRDCKRCTEFPLMTLAMIPFRMVHFFLTFWNIRLVQKWCPQCKHKLSEHHRIGGRFID